MKEGARQNLQAVDTYLAAHGIPRHIVKKIRIALTNDAIQESTAMKYDRIYTGIALAIRRAYGFGAERIIRGLREFDKVCGSVLTDDGPDDRDWTDIMQELKDETGIVIHTGDDDRLVLEISRK